MSESQIKSVKSLAGLLILPLRTLSHEAATISPSLVTTRVHDAAAGRETQILESLGRVPKASTREEMMDN